MTRNEALRLYRPTRAGIQRVLKAALHTCNAADWKRGATQLGVWSHGRIEVQDESALDMVADVGLFEPNQRGRRSYDRFLERQGKTWIRQTWTWPNGCAARAFQFSA